MSIKQQINHIFEAINRDDCDETLKIRKRNQIQKLGEAAAKYLEVVTRQGIDTQMYKGNRDQEVMDELVGIDQRRSRIHNSLIDQITIVNRLCEQYQLDPIYSGGTTRREKGNFALELVTDYFRNRL